MSITTDSQTWHEGPELRVPRGTRYEATVPDTLDLTERAEVALKGLGGTLDPAVLYQQFFLVRYTCKTPFMRHHAADTTCTPKHAESFPMMRLMCGSDRYADAEASMRTALLAMVEDGLYWNRYDPTRPWGRSYNPAFDGTLQTMDVSNVGGTGRMLRALVTWYELDRQPAWEHSIRDMVRGLDRIAIQRDDYAYYPDGGFGEPFNYPRSGWLRTDEPASETEGGEGSVVGYHGHPIQGLARWYALSGDDAALDLAGRLTRFCMLPRFWGGLPDPSQSAEGLVGHVAPRLPDPACVAGWEQGHWYSHFHARAIALRGILEYGRMTHDWRVLEFVRRAYEYTWTFGIPRMGWINCYPATRYNFMEGCALGDLVALGIRLSDAGIGDYWDDVDAVVRNQLIEQQLVRADALQRVADASPDGSKESDPYPGQEVREHVIARSLGNFGGHSTPVSIPQPWVMQCCTGNGTQGLYYAWEGIVREEADSAQINLLINRTARSLDMDSSLPYAGRVVIHNKTNRRLAVRVPGWVWRSQVRAQVSGSERRLDWVGNYLVFDGLVPNDTIVLEFPVRETTAMYAVNSRTKDELSYTCTFRGSTLVDISPRDERPTSYPLYERNHLRQDRCPMKTVVRFVPEHSILVW